MSDTSKKYTYFITIYVYLWYFKNGAFLESISNEKLKGVSYDSICATRKNYRDISKQRIN